MRLLLLLLLCSHAAAAQTLTRGPFLQQASDSSMLIVWRTDVASPSRVLAGASPEALDREVSLTDLVTQHEVRLTGLQPGTRYFYAVGTADTLLAGGDADTWFRTSAATGSGEMFRAWVVGDSGTGLPMQTTVMDAFLDWTRMAPAHAMLHLGDMAYEDGQEWEVQDHFFVPYQPFLRHTVLWPTLGNHEGRNAVSATQSGPYYDAMVLPKQGEAGGVPSGTEAFYSFNTAGVHVVVLDAHQSSVEPGSPMMAWLALDLAANTQRWLISTWHHPPYSKCNHDSDTDPELIRMREKVLPVLEGAGVDLVLTGHSHDYERTPLIQGAYETPSVAGGHIVDPGDGIPGSGGAYRTAGALHGAVYVVAGHGGREIRARSSHPLLPFNELAFGSGLLEVEGNALSYRNIREDGVVTDSFTILKGDGLVVGHPNGGERFHAGSMQPITWSSTGDVTAVTVEWSLDGGANWLVLARHQPANGSFAWRVPVVDVAAALVRVRAENGTFMDTSNGPFTLLSSERTTLLPFGATWSFEDQGMDPGPGWQDAAFDDSSWPTGAGQLGYGEGDEATLLYQPTPVFPSVYLRTSFTVDRPVESARLEVLLDDGVAVWLNGALVLERHVSNGTGHDVWASSVSVDNERFAVDLMGPGAFVQGRNVLAVVLKQANATSTDLSFDAQLTAVVPSALATNHAPTVMARDVVVMLPESLVLDLQAADEDGDALTFVAQTLPAGAVLDEDTGVVSWTPLADQVGTHVVSVDVWDAQGAKTVWMAMVQVVPPSVPDAGMPPDAAVELDASALEDAAVELDASVLEDAAVQLDASALEDAAVELDAAVAADAAEMDAGSGLDAAHVVDASPVPDAAGGMDASPVARVDASMATHVDAGAVPVDAASQDAGGAGVTPGCACDAAQNGPEWSLGLMLLVLARTGRRGRAQRHSTEQ